MVTLGKYSAAFHLVEKKPRVSQRGSKQVGCRATELRWPGWGAAVIGYWCRKKNRPGNMPGRSELKRLKYQRLGGLYVLVLFKNSDGRVFAEDGIFGDEDLFDLLL